MNAEIFAKIKATGRLPSPTGVVLKLLQMADAADTTAASIAPFVESDPAIASRLVRLANSPVGGYSRSIASVRKAVAFLGLRTVKMVALSFSLLSRHRTGQCE